MPTDYTYPVVEGTITEFPAFALSCARAFGALITMREDPMDAPIPDEIKPDTNYCETRLAADKKRLGEVQAMTNGEANAAAMAAHNEALASRSKYLAEKETEAARINAMLAKVHEWHPPTPEHVEMKKFMIDQLTISLPGDYAPSIPALLNGAAWRQQQIDRLAEAIVRNQKEIDKERERAAGRTEWIKALRASLEAA
jgi:hypothetical protein